MQTTIVDCFCTLFCFSSKMKIAKRLILKDLFGWVMCPLSSSESSESSSSEDDELDQLTGAKQKFQMTLGAVQATKSLALTPKVENYMDTVNSYSDEEAKLTIQKNQRLHMLICLCSVIIVPQEL